MSHGQRRDGDLASIPQVPTAAAGVHPFRLVESVAEGGCREIEVEGELDLAVADRLQQALAECRGDHVLIGLRACQFIDSTGLAVILDADGTDGTRIALHSPCNQVLRVLEVTGLLSRDLVFADREQALSALAGAAS